MSLREYDPRNLFRRHDSRHEGLSEDPFARMHREMDELFDRVFRGFSPSSLITGTSDNIVLRPSMDVAESEKQYHITVEMPGVDQKDIKLEIKDGVLTLKGEKKQEKEKRDKSFYQVERSYGSFSRSMILPEDVDEESVTASFKNGVLSIDLGRKELPKGASKKIEIKS